MALDFDPNKGQSAYPGMPRDPSIPKNILSQELISSTALGVNCFAYQRFSNRLQAYLIDYVSKIYGDYPVYH